MHWRLGRQVPREPGRRDQGLGGGDRALRSEVNQPRVTCLGATDRASAEDAVIVSASAAARYWPGRDPVGQRLVVPTQRGVGPPDQLRWMPSCVDLPP